MGGEYSLPIVSSYSYLGIDFSSNGAWDMHIKKLLDHCRKKLISYIKLLVTGILIKLLSVIRPSIYRV